MLTRDGFDMIKVLKNYSAKSERREKRGKKLDISAIIILREFDI